MTKKGRKIQSFGWGKIFILALLITVLVRFFALESFRISSSSMEAAILNGDFLIVNKTSFLTTPQRNSVQLFNSPLVRDTANEVVFLSRCIGIPGDTLELKDNELSINGKVVPKSPGTLVRYQLKDGIEKTILRQLDRLHIPVREPEKIDSVFFISLTPFEEYRLREELPVVFNERIIAEKTENYKLAVPRKNRAYRLDAGSLMACKEIILAETEGKAVFRNGKLFLDGREASFFFFKHDYYWMLSDNTTDGIDSRHLGFIPDSHIIGQALFIWMSKVPQTNIIDGYRWNRIFKTVN